MDDDTQPGMPVSGVQGADETPNKFQKTGEPLDTIVGQQHPAAKAFFV